MDNASYYWILKVSRIESKGINNGFCLFHAVFIARINELCEVRSGKTSCDRVIHVTFSSQLYYIVCITPHHTKSCNWRFLRRCLSLFGQIQRSLQNRDFDNSWRIWPSLGLNFSPITNYVSRELHVYGIPSFQLGIHTFTISIVIISDKHNQCYREITVILPVFDCLVFIRLWRQEFGIECMIDNFYKHGKIFT